MPRWMETLAYGVAGIAWVAPAERLYAEYGLTAPAITARVKARLG